MTPATVAALTSVPRNFHVSCFLGGYQFSEIVRSLMSVYFCGYHSSHDEGSHHTRCPTQSYCHHDDRGQDERHERHSAHGVSTHDGYSIGSHSGEEEGDDCHQQDGHEAEAQHTTHHVPLEEEEGGYECHDGSHGNCLHGDVLLGALHVTVGSLLVSHFRCRQFDGSSNQFPALDDAYHPCHGNASYALGISEQIFGRCRSSSESLCYLHVGEEQSRGRHYHPPYQYGTAADDEGILQSHYISHAQYGCACVAFKHQFGFFGHGISPQDGSAGEVLVPQSEGGHGKVIQAAQQSCYQQGLGL